MPFENFTASILGSFFSPSKEKHFTFIDNYIVFSNKEALLKQFIHFNITRKTLNSNLNYREINDYLSFHSNILFYMNNARADKIWEHYLSPKLFKQYKENNQYFHKIQGLALELSAENDMLYNNLFIKYSPAPNKNARTMWESLLDTTINHKPAFVINHYTKDKEIFVQDMKNNVYLINKVGRILWKIQLNEKIISDIYQIDYYKNGKLQLLFSSKNYIHLLDRNGNYVERYPVKLRSPATNGIAVFDYDKRKEYRIFVACKNKKVYNYEKDGTTVKGWQFNKTDTRVNNDIQHFRVGTKDYIAFADQYKIYILNRRGEVRVPVKNHFPRSKNNLFELEENIKNPRLVTTDTAGLIHRIYFDGNTDHVKIKNFNPQHFFEYKDVDADSKKDYIFVYNNKLEVYNQNKKMMFEKKFDNTIQYGPIYFSFSKNDRKLGIVSNKENKIYLINKDGSLYKGFPLKGNTPFSISYFEQNFSKFNLIVGSKENFLYNYTLQ